MIKKFAIEPKSVKRWKDFRYVMEKLGFAEGRVLARYPKGWPKALLNELSDLSDIERLKISEKLRQYQQDRMISLGEPYDPKMSWLQNVAGLPNQKLDGIILDHLPPSVTVTVPVGTPTVIDEDFFSSPREICCLNTPEDLFIAAQLLLSETCVAYFIDPYFKVDQYSRARVLVPHDRSARTMPI